MTTAHVGCANMSGRRNKRAARACCQALAKVYDAAHPRARKK